jgi:hypothetical protein
VIVVVAEDPVDIEFAGAYESAGDWLVTIRQGEKFCHIPKETVKCIYQPIDSETLAGT